MTQALTSRQAIFVFSMFYLGSAMLSLTGLLASDAGQDAWISVLVALIVHALTIPLYMALGKQMEEQSFGDYLTGLFGSLVGKGVAAAFVLLFPFFIYTFGLFDLTQFIHTLVLPRTPTSATILMYTIVIVAGCYNGIKTIGRTSELTFPILIGFVVVIAVSLTPQIEWKNLRPVLDNGFAPTVKASLPLIGYPYWEMSMFLFVLPYLKDRKKFGHILLHSAWISGAVFFVTTTITILVLGPRLSSHLVYPSYFVTRTISIGDFYERFEEIFTFVWYIMIYYRLSIMFFVTVEGLAYAFSIASKQRLLIPLALIGITLSKYAAPNVTAHLNGIHDLPLGYSGLFGLLVPAVLLLIGKIKNRPA
ncbi:GerAB/ArcD/ProY family transporter [Cohnella panacarvi]|uniref:GerAB/ArcD/ProY family transporter n=1 Tax=Cohnella panacarvi TaxID=400776 RepID=UPI00047C6C9A|nr:endospore germination permease [Cohnella panacarvi]